MTKVPLGNFECICTNGCVTRTKDDRKPLSAVKVRLGYYDDRSRSNRKPLLKCFRSHCQHTGMFVMLFLCNIKNRCICTGRFSFYFYFMRCSCTCWFFVFHFCFMPTTQTATFFAMHNVFYNTNKTYYC